MLLLFIIDLGSQLIILERAYNMKYSDFMQSVKDSDYFGWNFMPMSDTEILCDGIFVLIAALAFVNQEQK